MNLSDCIFIPTDEDEVFKSKELAVQYITALHGNYPDKHYQITKVELDTDNIE